MTSDMNSLKIDLRLDFQPEKHPTSRHYDKENACKKLKHLQS